MQNSAPAKRIGLLVSNLGSPDSPNVSDVRKYLKQFLNDPFVFDAPWIIRYPFVNGIILTTRPKKSAEAYSKIWTKEGSPLVVHTKNLTAKLKKELPFPIEFGMRYGKPSIETAIEKLVNQAVNHVIFLPLYPQYSLSASETSIHEFEQSLKKFKGRISGSVIESFHDHDSFIAAAEEKMLTTFQSRLGPVQWIKPYTDHVLKELPKQGKKRIIAVSPSFTADCLETLEEIQLRYSEDFLAAGGEEFRYVPCVNSSDAFVKAVKDIIQPYTAQPVKP